MTWETPGCSGCRANSRMRSIVHQLSREFFGKSLPLSEFPVRKNIKGIGMTDSFSYAIPLAEKFDYTNTYYHCEPFFDITAHHPERYGTLDFVISSDVFEHIAPPVQRAFDEVRRLLKPAGRFILTVPSSLDPETREHYPDLHEYGVTKIADKSVIVNRKKDGSIQVHLDPVFHGGDGTTLEMRLFSRQALSKHLTAAGFDEVVFLDEAEERYGIVFDGAWGHPLVARPGAGQPVPLPTEQKDQEEEIRLLHAREKIDALQDENGILQMRLAHLSKQIALASESRWLRLGRKLGLGPKFH